MSMIVSANSMPVWSYYMWGGVGLLLLYFGATTLTIHNDDGSRQIDLLAVGEVGFGLFLMYYWLVRIT